MGATCPDGFFTAPSGIRAEVQRLAPGRLDLVWREGEWCVVQRVPRMAPDGCADGSMTNWTTCLRLGQREPDTRILRAVYELRIDPATGMTAGDRRRWAALAQRARTEAKAATARAMNSPDMVDLTERIHLDNGMRAQLGFGPRVRMPGAATTAAPLLGSASQEVPHGHAHDLGADASCGAGASA